jgi:hypothetical protein
VCATEKPAWTLPIILVQTLLCALLTHCVSSSPMHSSACLLYLPAPACLLPQPVLACLQIVSVDAVAGVLVLGGVDVVDGSPVLDIKPYVPFSDALPDATAPEWVTVSCGCTFFCSCTLGTRSSDTRQPKARIGRCTCVNLYSAVQQNMS